MTKQELTERPLSYSSLKAFRKSPLHYIHYLHTAFVPTDAILLGSVIDVLLLTPDEFKKKFTVYEKFAKRSNADKEKWEAMIIQAQKEKKALITTETHEKALLIITSALKDDYVRLIVENIKATQIKLKWNDKETGLPVVGYVDFETEINGVTFVGELKTTINANPEDFMRQAYNLSYPLQIGAYSDGYHKAKYKFPEFLYIALETTEPYGCSVLKVSQKYLDYGKDEFKGTLKAFKYCLDNDLFHLSYSFRLFNTRSYFAMDLPGYKKILFGEF